jgi:hypothetical protein
VQRAHRWTAACAAALAATGKGTDADSVDDTERVQLRKRALEWLRVDLTEWSRQARSANVQERAQARDQLGIWRISADLAGLRDESALRQLPADERLAWQRFWSEVSRVIESKP